MKSPTSSSRVWVAVLLIALCACGCRAPMWRPRLWLAQRGAEVPVQQPPAMLAPAPGPVLEGTTLAGPPTKSATEIGLELRDEIADLEATRGVLEDRIAAQSVEMERLNGLLASAEETIGADREELAEARVELDAWQLELAELYEKLREREERRGRELAELAQLVADTVAEYGVEDTAAETPPAAVPQPAPEAPDGAELSALP